jgi:PhzF family phenazine biosynthesis protein
MQTPIYIVNAFSTGPFSGNPAAVCPLDHWLSDENMQAIAEQHNLSETVFFVKENNDYAIRWFTPTIEVPLCGHATLAAAYVLFNELNYPHTEIRFQSKSGELKILKDNDILVLNFPSETIADLSLSILSEKEISTKPLYIGKGRVFILIEVATEKEVIEAKPNLIAINTLDAAGVIITAKGESVDFVSRVFAPQSGINEDPVTGSAHCLLIPYWAQKLNKQTLVAKQVSKRGGVLHCTLSADRVLIGGRAELYLKGVINYEL